MQLSKEKIELLKKALPELYELVLNTTSLLEKDLEYVKNLSQDEIEKLDNEDPASLEIDLKLTSIKKRASEICEKLKGAIKNCETSIGVGQGISLTDVLSSEDVIKSLSFNERFIASAVATAVSKIKH